MSEIIPEKTHQLLEKLADYVMTEVPRKSEVASKDELGAVKQELGAVKQELKTDINELHEDVRDTKRNVKLILDGMDSQIKEGEILKTEQIAIKSGLKRVEKRVDVLEKKVG
ncbi:hypothetical protein HQ585_19530 [candidate division KSB1 bacterium]|nr:hypothetical protein [candidate division KSB1 bacterium]